MEAHGAYARERDGALVFAHDASAPVVALPAADAAGPLERVRADDASTPRQARVRFFDPERDYRAATIAARRGALAAGDGVIDFDLPLALDAGQAEAIAEASLVAARAATDTASLDVAPWRLDIEVGDRLDLSALGAGIFRVERIKEEGARTLFLAGVAESGLRGVSGAEVGAGAGARPIVQPRVVLLDLPPLPGAEADDRPLAAVYADPWPGAVDLLIGGTRRGRASAPAGIGALVASLPAGPIGRWDEASTLEFEMPGAAFASLSAEAALAFGNLVAVRHAEGEWELVAAREAELVGPDRWRLRGLVRGLAGTERSAAAPAGAFAVRIDQALVRIDVAAHERGAILSVVAVPQGRRASDPEAASIEFAANDVWARPFAPAHLRARAEPDGALALTWIRRARLDGDAWTGEPPLGEESERYLVEVLVEDAVVRAAETSAPSWMYSAADQAADLAGRAPSARTIRVAQISARFGVGRSAVLQD